MRLLAGRLYKIMDWIAKQYKNAVQKGSTRVNTRQYKRHNKRVQEKMTEGKIAVGGAGRIIVWAALILGVLASPCLAFVLTPTDPQPGQQVTLTGTAGPGEEVSFKSSFSMNLPVNGGQYEYEASINVPQKPNRFTVAASNVEDFNAGVKVGIWITKGFSPSGGSVRLSQEDVPPGHYNLKMFGKALSGASAVPVTVEAQTAVKADSSGRYELVIDTSGIPAGDYRITGAGDSQVIRLGGGGSSATSSMTSSATSSTASTKAAGSAQSSAAPVAVNRETVLWYAEREGLPAKNSSQYDLAKEQLEQRLSGGYWKIIRRGEPLTEEAGDCLQEFCLVRGTDACTVCRDKDIILKGGKASGTSRTGQEAAGVAGSARAGAGQGAGSGDGDDGAEGGFFSSAAEWIDGLLGMLGRL